MSEDMSSVDGRFNATPEKTPDTRKQAQRQTLTTPATAAESNLSPITPKGRRYQVTSEIEEEA